MTKTTAVATLKSTLPAMQMQEAQLIEVLRNSLYPGAKDDSIRMVVGYCQAAGLDPMQKPVHIVPMSVKKAGTNDYEMRDVVMPGIGLYRTQAARSGHYGGISEPEFGPDKELAMNDYKVTYPEWCRVTVRRIQGDRVVEFTANERWLENYATAGRDTKKPNAMWTRRPYAQLAKCAQAQALRMAFPEIGAQPTAEEIEGKTLHDDDLVIDAPSTRIQEPQRKSEPKADAASAQATSGQPVPGVNGDGGNGGGGNGADSGALMTAGMKKTVRSRMDAAKVDDAKLEAQFHAPLDKLPASKVNDVLAWLRDMAEAAQG